MNRRMQLDLSCTEALSKWAVGFAQIIGKWLFFYSNFHVCRFMERMQVHTWSSAVTVTIGICQVPASYTSSTIFCDVKHNHLWTLSLKHSKAHTWTLHALQRYPACMTFRTCGEINQHRACAQPLQRLANIFSWSSSDPHYAHGHVNLEMCESLRYIPEAACIGARVSGLGLRGPESQAANPENLEA